MEKSSEGAFFELLAGETLLESSSSNSGTVVLSSSDKRGVFGKKQKDSS